MLRVGLTGSIGVGKSFVTSVFEELGCHVLDADQTAREVVMPDTPGLRALTDAFGEEILNTDGTLNRKRLGARIFTDQAERERLNHILHPFIIARQDEIMRGWEAEDRCGIDDRVWRLQAV
jgi:dephospho-CoA kinase